MNQLERSEILLIDSMIKVIFHMGPTKSTQIFIQGRPGESRMETHGRCPMNGSSRKWPDGWIQNCREFVSVGGDSMSDIFLSI